MHASVKLMQIDGKSLQEEARPKEFSGLFRVIFKGLEIVAVRDGTPLFQVKADRASFDPASSRLRMKQVVIVYPQKKMKFASRRPSGWKGGTVSSSWVSTQVLRHRGGLRGMVPGSMLRGGFVV